MLKALVLEGEGLVQMLEFSLVLEVCGFEMVVLLF